MLFINYLRKTILYDEMILIRDFLNALKKFGKTGGKIKLYKKIRACYKRYDWEPEEYFAFHYEILTEQERWDYISEREHVRMANSFNTKDSAAILFDKWKTYEVLKPFFKRKACLFRGLIDEENERKWKVNYKATSRLFWCWHQNCRIGINKQRFYSEPCI